MAERTQATNDGGWRAGAGTASDRTTRCRTDAAGFGSRVQAEEPISRRQAAPEHAARLTSPRRRVHCWFCRRHCSSSRRGSSSPGPCSKDRVGINRRRPAPDGQPRGRWAARHVNAGRPFKIYVPHHAHGRRGGRAQWSAAAIRASRVSGFLRKRASTVPQFINVLCGEMTLIGPERPSSPTSCSRRSRTTRSAW
jgi:hypothetical protein